MIGDVADPLSACLGESDSISLDVGIKIYAHVESPSFLSFYSLFCSFICSFPPLPCVDYGFLYAQSLLIINCVFQSQSSNRQGETFTNIFDSTVTRISSSSRLWACYLIK